MLINLKKTHHPLGILSSNNKTNIVKFLKNYRIDFFDFIYSEKNLFGKSRAIDNLLKKQDLKPQEIIYVGDEIRDIEAAKKSKIKVVAVTWGFNTKAILEKMKPDFLVENPDELLKILSEKC